MVKKTLGCHGDRIFSCHSKHFHRNPSGCLRAHCPLLAQHTCLPRHLSPGQPFSHRGLWLGSSMPPDSKLHSAHFSSPLPCVSKRHPIPRLSALGSQALPSSARKHLPKKGKVQGSHPLPRLVSLCRLPAPGALLCFPFPSSPRDPLDSCDRSQGRAPGKGQGLRPGRNKGKKRHLLVEAERGPVAFPRTRRTGVGETGSEPCSLWRRGPASTHYPARRDSTFPGTERGDRRPHQEVKTEPLVVNVGC